LSEIEAAAYPSRNRAEIRELHEVEHAHAWMSPV
jgi:hypothetical protein